MTTTDTKLYLSNTAPAHIQSEIRAMSVECERVGGINMAQGICDTDLPRIVEESAVEAIRSGFNTYTRLDGIEPLRRSIAEKLQRDNSLTADPNSEILVTSGATGALYAALRALLNPGDEVLLFEPFYGYHVSTLRSLALKPIIVPLAGLDWQIDFDEVRRAITPQTRALVLNTPSNPSGKVFSLEEQETLASMATEHDLFVFTDEIYEYFLFDGVRHVSIATLPEMKRRTITISGLSKTFSITGWRIGYIAAAAEWIPAIGYFHDLTYVCAPAPLQHGAAAGLAQLANTSFYQDLASSYQKKRDLFCDALAASGLRPSIPSGAYYVLAEASHLPGETAAAKARFLLQKTGVAAVAGSAFFRAPHGENLLRFCFGKNDADLQLAAERLASLTR